MGRRKRRAWQPYVTPAKLLLASAPHTIGDLPTRQRVRALRVLADTSSNLFTEFEQPLPEWVQELASLADQDEAWLKGYDALLKSFKAGRLPA